MVGCTWRCGAGVAFCFVGFVFGPGFFVLGGVTGFLVECGWVFLFCLAGVLVLFVVGYCLWILVWCFVFGALLVRWCVFVLFYGVLRGCFVSSFCVVWFACFYFVLWFSA